MIEGTDDPGGRPAKARRLRFVTGGAWLLVVLLLTLSPSRSIDPAGGPEAVSVFCVLCGAYGLADFARNVLFFLPLGMALGPSLGALRAGLAVAFLSLGIETIQLSVPGRYPTLGDLLANGAGGFAGAFLVLRWRTLIASAVRPSPLRRSVTWSFAALLLLLPALTFRPDYPERLYYFQWTADLGGQLSHYEGTILAAEVDGRPAPQGRVRDSRSWLIPALGREAPIDLQFVVGPSPPKIAPVFSIYDDRAREMLLIGVFGNDLVLRRRQVAERLRLDQPILRWPGAMRDRAEGDTVRLRIERRVVGADAFRRAALCFELEDEMRCDLHPGVEAGWAMLYNRPRFTPRTAVLLSLIWTALLGGMVGLGSSSILRAAAAAAALIVLAAVVTWMSSYLSLHPVPLIGLLVGAATGYWCRGIEGSAM